MLQDLDTSGAKVAFDIALHSSPDALFDSLVLALLRHEHALEGIVIESEDLSRALSARPVRTRMEAEVFQSVRNLRNSYEMLFRMLAPGLDFNESELVNGDPLLAEWAADFAALNDPESKSHSPINAKLAERFLQMIESGGAGLCKATKLKVEFRNRPTSPGVYHLPVIEHKEIEAEFAALFDSYEKEWMFLHPIECVSEFHFRFMEIFPYNEMTGLVGRLLVNAHLIWSHLPPTIILQSDRHNYFNALNGSSSDLIDIFYNGVQVSQRYCKKLLGV